MKYYVIVNYSGQKTTQEYTYLAKKDLDLKVGDGVLVTTPRGIVVALVKQVDVPKPDFKCKWAFQKIDMEAAMTPAE